MVTDLTKRALDPLFAPEERDEEVMKTLLHNSYKLSKKTLFIDLYDLSSLFPQSKTVSDAVLISEATMKNSVKTLTKNLESTYDLLKSISLLGDQRHDDLKPKELIRELKSLTLDSAD